MFQLFLRLGVFLQKMLGFNQEDGRNELKGSIEKRATSAPVSSRMTRPAWRAGFEEWDSKWGEQNKQFDVSSASKVREVKRIRQENIRHMNFVYVFGLFMKIKHLI